MLTSPHYDSGGSRTVFARDARQSSNMADNAGNQPPIPCWHDSGGTAMVRRRVAERPEFAARPSA